MGCDIHLHLEVRRRGSKSWHNVGFMSEFSSRVYDMFALLGNTRNYGKYTPICHNRGVPEDVNCMIIWKYYKCIKPKKVNRENYEYEYDRDDVKNWCRNNLSHLKKIDGILYCSDPDAHSESWCTAAEMRECFEEVFRLPDGNLHGDYIEYLALVSLMEGCENEEYECRAVYWFDN